MADIDREKTIEGLKRYLNYPKPLCDVAQQAITLLKEQEAVKPYSMNAERTYGICPKCGKLVFRYSNVEENHYCGICGQAVKWDE